MHSQWGILLKILRVGFAVRRHINMLDDNMPQNTSFI